MTVQDLIENKGNQVCCGCTACKTVCPKQCITMVEDSEGFLYPKVDTNLCIDCQACVRVCPFHNPAEEAKPKNVYAALNKNEEIRKDSSSGGVFTILAEKVINEGGIVFGAKFTDDWQVKNHRRISRFSWQQISTGKDGQFTKPCKKVSARRT